MKMPDDRLNSTPIRRCALALSALMTLPLAPAVADETLQAARFHHVHLNVTDPEANKVDARLAWEGDF